MTIHIEFVEDVQGDVVDTKVYCNSTCAYLNDKAEAYPTGYESDTCVYCANDGCNSVVITGIDCESCRVLCGGCMNLDTGTSHRCRADSASCVDGESCPDFIGEGNCTCEECK